MDPRSELGLIRKQYKEYSRNIGESVTKDMVAGRLRRLINLAVAKSGEQPPTIN